MRFVHPHMLWLLLLLPLLVLFHRRRRRPRRIVSATVSFWKQIPSAPLKPKRLDKRQWLALVLDCLFLLGLIGALAHPWFPAKRRFPSSSKALIAIDNSLSMGAREVAEQVQRTYSHLLNELPPTCQVQVISWSDGIYPVAEGRASDASLGKACREIEPTRAANATDVLAGYVRSYRSLYDAPCFLISDGRFKPTGQLSNLILCPVQSNGSNLAISDVSASDTEGPQELSVHIARFGDNKPCEIELRSGDIVQQQSTDSDSVRFSLEKFSASEATLRILTPDSNPVDNEFPLSLAWAIPKKIGLAGDVSKPLGKLLASLNPVPSLSRLESETTEKDFDLVIANGVVPDLAAVYTRSLLSIDPPNPVFPFSEFVQEPTSGMVWFSGAPALGGMLADSSIFIGRFRTGQITQGSIIAESEGYPIIAIGEKGGVRYTTLPFSPEGTGLTKTWVYPVLMAEIIEWLTGTNNDRPEVFYSETESDLSRPVPVHEIRALDLNATNALTLAMFLPVVSLCAMLVFIVFLVRLRSWEGLVRMTMAALAFLALFPFTLGVKNDAGSVAYLMDVSPSVSESLKEWNMDSLPRMKDAGETFIAFAEEPAVVNKNDFLDKNFPPLGLNTNLESALALAANRLPTTGRRAIGLLSDGRDNRGDSASIRTFLSEASIPIYHIPLGRREAEDPRIANLRVPEVVKPGEMIPVQVFLEGQCDSAALRVGDQERAVSLTGRSVETFTVSFPEPGVANIVAELSTTEDIFAKNNRMERPVRVSGPTQVLVITQDPPSVAGGLVEAAGGAASTALSESEFAEALPSTEVAVIEGSVELSEAICTEISDRVKKGQLNLMFFGANGLISTKWGPLEELSPVRVGPSMDGGQVFLVIDKSGSMSSERTGQATYAKALGAAEQVWANVPPEMQAGVIVFDAEARVMQPLTRKGDSRLDATGDSVPLPHGGTLLGPAVTLAIERFGPSTDQDRRILVISDGEFADESMDLTKTLLGEKQIVLDAFPVDSESPETLLDLVKATGGAVLNHETVGDLKDWLTPGKDSKESEQEWFSDETRTPVIDEYPVLFPQLSPQSSPVRAWVKNEVRPRAINLVALSESASLVAAMRFGLGKTAALTLSDKEMDWLAEDGNASIVTQVLAWLSSAPSSDPSRLDLHALKDVLRFRLKTEELFEEQLQARVATPFGEVLSIRLDRDSPVLFSGSVLMSETGEYGIDITNPSGETLARSRWVHSAPSEYRLLGPQGSSVDEASWKDFVREIPAKKGHRDLRPLLLWSALLLLPVLIAGNYITARKK